MEDKNGVEDQAELFLVSYRIHITGHQYSDGLIFIPYILSRNSKVNNIKDL